MAQQSAQNMPPELGRPIRRRVRAPTACQRCRKHKIKCTGVAPCATCEVRGSSCVFASPEDRISVPASTFRALKSRIHELEDQQHPRYNQAHYMTPSATNSHGDEQHAENTTAINHVWNPLSGTSYSSDQNDHFDNQESSTFEHPSPTQSGLSNPLVPTRPVYVSGQHGNLRYLGHSSSRSFSRQALLLIDRNTNTTASLPASFFAESDIDNDYVNMEPLKSVDMAGLPSLELSLFYIQNVKFRTQPLYYLFDEVDFVSKVHGFYGGDMLTLAESYRLWYVHFLLIMSLGKALSAPRRSQESPYGSALFERALQLLPHISYMCRDFVASTEILCCLALFLESIGHRCAGHVHIGQAIRMAQMHGLHTDMQANVVGADLLARGRRLWWTVYTLDRRLSSSMGIPSVIHDLDVTAPITSTRNSDLSSAAQAIGVKICQLLGRILSTVYSFDGTLNKTFLITAKQVLTGIGRLASELTHFASRSPGEVSRVVSHLNLAYHQCIILTTRPMLFYLLKLRIESSDASSHKTVLSSTKGLVQACIDSAVQVALIISQLQQHDLLDTFLPFDLESAFSAAMVLVMASRIHHKLVPEENHVATLFAAFDYMTTKGNTLATSRKIEIEALGRLGLSSKKGRQRPQDNDRGLDSTISTTSTFTAAESSTCHPAASISVYDPAIVTPPALSTSPTAAANIYEEPVTSPDVASVADLASLPSIGEPFFDEWILTDGLSGTQIMDLADALHPDVFDAPMEL